MTITEPVDSRQLRLITIDQFDTCLIDGKTREEIIALYPTREQGAYYLDKLDRYLQEHHQMTIKDYCVRFGGIVWPLCPTTGKEVGYKTACGKGLLISRFIRGAITKDTCPAFEAACERFSVERRGEGNPMFGKESWNKGVTAADHPSMARVAESMRGRPVSDEERKRRSEFLKNRPPLHAMPHSPETVEKMRVITARRWAEGSFNQGVTSIHLKMREFLQSLPLTETFDEEHQVVYYSLDFAFKSAKVGIECDGDYFHINPQFYPDGPKDSIQRRNAGRDKAKNAFLRNCGWTLIRVWECDINAGTFKEPLLCKLRESGLLDR